MVTKEEKLLEMLDIAIKILVENEHCCCCAYSGMRDCQNWCDCESGIYDGLERKAMTNIKNSLDELGNRKAS